jgi:hypothetical protein
MELSPFRGSLADHGTLSEAGSLLRDGTLSLSGSFRLFGTLGWGSFALTFNGTLYPNGFARSTWCSLYLWLDALSFNGALVVYGSLWLGGALFDVGSFGSLPLLGTLV